MGKKTTTVKQKQQTTKKLTLFCSFNFSISFINCSIFLRSCAFSIDSNSAICSQTLNNNKWNEKQAVNQTNYFFFEKNIQTFAFKWSDSSTWRCISMKFFINSVFWHFISWQSFSRRLFSFFKCENENRLINFFKNNKNFAQQHYLSKWWWSSSKSTWINNDGCK